MERRLERAPLARGVMLALCLMGLVGCGGGGGGGNVRSDPPPPAPSAPNPPTTPPVTPPPVTPTVPADAHLVAIRASEVRRFNTSDGTGTTILFMDSGVNFAHPSLDDDASRSTTWVGLTAPDTSLADANGHGTAVAQIAAGSWQGMFPGGVATGSLSMASLRMLDDKAPDGGQTLTQDALTFLKMQSGTSPRTILNISADNLRWVTDTPVYTGTPVYEGFADLSGANGKDILTVVEAGNSGQAQPSMLARLPFERTDDRDLQSGWLVVGALDSLAPNRLADYSNQCGVAKNSCLVAPGDVVVNGARDTAGAETYRTLHGTDYAAAQASGAAALVWSRFPYFDNNLVRQTLLGSATDLGAPGVDEVFGYGLLNVEKALRGPSRFDWGDVHVFPDRTDTFWENDISGSGGLIVGLGNAVYATLWLTGNNTYTGKTVLESDGVLVINGNFASPLEIRRRGTVSASSGTWSGDVDIQYAGQLYFAWNTQRGKVVITGDVHNDGMLNFDPTTNGVFEGDFSQGSTGQLGLYLGAPVLKIGGTAQLDGSLYIFGIVPGYVAKAHTELLVAEGGVTGTFQSMYWTPAITLVANLGYDAKTVWLDVVRADVQNTASAMGLTAMSVGSAQRIENAFDELDAQGPDAGVTAFEEGAAKLQRIGTADNFERSMDSLSGELHDMDAAFAMMAIDGNRRALESRMDAVDSGERAGAWSRRMDGTRGSSSFDVSTNGWLLGFDQPGRDGMTVGASLSQTDGNAWHSQRFDRERNRQVDAQMYASWNLGEGAYVLGSASFGHMQRWLQREVMLGDEAYRVSSDYAHRYGALALQSGRRIPFGDRTTITPYIGMQTLQLARDGFSEEGASGFGLTSDDASMSATQALAGARWNHDWTGGSTRWALSGRVEWQRLLSQSGSSIQARFTGMDAWAPIVADGLDRDVGLFGLGLEGGIGTRSTLRFDVDSRYGDGEQWSGAMATWTTAF